MLNWHRNKTNEKKLRQTKKTKQKKDQTCLSIIYLPAIVDKFVVFFLFFFYKIECEFRREIQVVILKLLKVLINTVVIEL